MRSNLIGGLIGLLLVPAVCSRSAPGRPCERAFNQALQIKDWRQLRQIRKQFPRCDDGAVAEMYSDFVVHTLATRWGSLRELSVEIAADGSFRDFVLRHIDSTTDVNELKMVKRNADRLAPRGMTGLIRAISAGAARAMTEQSALLGKSPAAKPAP